jgi:hypothetical protein
MKKYNFKAPVALPDSGNGCDHPGNGNGHAGITPTKVITGRNLAHVRRSKTERAFLAADHTAGKVKIVYPTLAQSAKIFDVSYDYAFRAAHMSAAARLAVETGHRTIYDKPDGGIICAESWHRMTTVEQKKWVADHAIELWMLIESVTAPAAAAAEPAPAAPAPEEEADPSFDPFAEIEDVFLPEGM